MTYTRRLPSRRVLLLLASAGPALALAQQADTGAAVPSLPKVEVIHQTPLPGMDVPVNEYPGNAQLADDQEIGRSGATNLADFLNRRIPSISIAEVQGSPYQLDLSYRGFRISPLLGSPQGLSVYIDGVRVNQPLGDVMDWDMVPEMALTEMALIPGSNPLYGLNTLGGALVLGTKSGITHPGTELDVSFGSYARKRVAFGHGQQWGDGWHAYAAGTWFEENGWRDLSPGHLGNAFLKIGRDYGDTDWSLSYTYGRSNLMGNGLVSQSLYDIDRAAGYTFYDQTRNQSSLLNFQLNHTISPSDSIALVAWARTATRRGSNGDINDDWEDWIEDCEDREGEPECLADPSNPDWEEYNATHNDTKGRASEIGVTAQWTHEQGAHKFVVGGEVARTTSRFDQYERDAMLDARRIAQAVPGSEREHEVSLRGKGRRFSLFAADSISIGSKTRLDLSARWDASRVTNRLGQPTPYERESFSYHKLNPAIGVTHKFSDRVTGFASFTQGTRMPSALELGCADPANPCRMEVGLQADPYLKQLVTRTLEIGAHVQPAQGIQLTGTIFRSITKDDIAFMRSTLQEGYFDNIGKTRRQGVELSARARRSNWDLRASYSYLDATYRSHGILFGPLSSISNPNEFHPGTRMAALPRHIFRVSADWWATPVFSVGGDLLMVGSAVAAGNEHGGRPKLGKVPSYNLVNARASWNFSKGWTAYLRVNNVFNKHYATYVTGSEDAIPGGVIVSPGDDMASARFLAPGAPRTAYIGVHYKF